MPEEVLNTYMKLQEGLETYNTIPGGLGEPFTKRCGIPQGDQLSMMFMGLYLKPWTTLMDSVGATPRVLADDMLSITHGDDHVKVFEKR